MTVDIPESLTEGAKAKYSCTNRYKLVGDSVLTCENGKWAGDVPYCKGTYSLRKCNYICMYGALNKQSSKSKLIEAFE